MARCKHENGELRIFLDRVLTFDVQGGRSRLNDDFGGDDALYLFDCDDCGGSYRHTPKSAPMWLRDRVDDEARPVE